MSCASVGVDNLYHQGIAYQNSVDISSLKKRKDDILRMMSLISKSGGDIEEQIHLLLSLPYELDIRDYTKAIQSCNNSRLLSLLMKELHNRGLVPDLLLYNVYLKKCEDFRDKEEAFHTYSQLLADNIQPDKHTIIILIRCCLQSGSVFEAEDVLKDAFSRNVEVNSYMYNLLIDFYARRNQPAEAFRLRMQMSHHSIAPDEYTISSLMAACCPVLPSRSDLLFLLEDVRSAPLPARSVCVSALFSGITKASQLENHQKLRVIVAFYDALRSRGYVLGQHAYTSLMACCAKVGALAQAKAFLHDMEKTGVEPNQYILTAFISTCSKAKDYAAALGVFNFMRSVDSRDRKCRPNKYTYEAMLVAAGNAGELTDAFQIYSDMLEEGIIPDTSTFARLLIVCGLCGDLHRGLQIVEEFTQRGLPRTSFYYHALIDLYARCNQLPMALSVLDEVKESPSVEASHYHYEPIVRLLVETRRWSQVDTLLAAWSEISYTTLQFLIVNSYKQGLWSRVLQYEGQMRANGQRPCSALLPLIEQAKSMQGEVELSPVTPTTPMISMDSLPLLPSVIPATPETPASPTTPATPITPVTPSTPREGRENTMQFLEGKVKSIPEFIPMHLRKTSKPMFLKSTSVLYPSVSRPSWSVLNSVLGDDFLFGKETNLSLDDLDLDLSTDFDFFNDFDSFY